MTSNHNNTDSRDEVLFAFDQACSCPSAAQIIEWCERYPQFAEDIRAHAAISRDMAARATLPAEKANETMLARGFSRVLNLLYDAEKVAATAATPQSFQQVMAARDTDPRRLACELDIERGVLADLFGGRMRAPVGERLVAALTAALAMTRGAFDAALDFVLRTPSAAHAKATQAPTAAPRTYEAIIRSSGMSEERKRYWLGED